MQSHKWKVGTLAEVRSTPHRSLARSLLLRLTLFVSLVMQMFPDNPSLLGTSVLPHLTLPPTLPFLVRSRSFSFELQEKKDELSLTPHPVFPFRKTIRSQREPRFQDPPPSPSAPSTGYILRSGPARAGDVTRGTFLSPSPTIHTSDGEARRSVACSLVNKRTEAEY